MIPQSGTLGRLAMARRRRNRPARETKPAMLPSSSRMIGKDPFTGTGGIRMPTLLASLRLSNRPASDARSFQFLADRLLTAGARELETPDQALPLDAAHPMIARTAPPERVPVPKSRRRSGTETSTLSRGRPVVSTARPGLAIASTRNGRRTGRPKAISAPGPKRRGTQAA